MLTGGWPGYPGFPQQLIGLFIHTNLGLIGIVGLGIANTSSIPATNSAS